MSARYGSVAYTDITGPTRPAKTLKQSARLSNCERARAASAAQRWTKPVSFLELGFTGCESERNLFPGSAFSVHAERSDNLLLVCDMPHHGAPRQSERMSTMTACSFSASGTYYQPDFFQVPAGLLSVGHQDTSGATYKNEIEIRSELDVIAALGANWDGGGSLAISPYSIKLSFHLLSFLSTIPDPLWPSVGPMPDGTVSMTWELGEKEVWIYVLANGYKVHKWESSASFEAKVETYSDPGMLRELFAWLRR